MTKWPPDMLSGPGAVRHPIFLETGVFGKFSVCVHRTGCPVLNTVMASLKTSHWVVTGQAVRCDTLLFGDPKNVELEGNG